jgi:DNA-binding CsgD family transcriptional regulator
VSFDAQVAGLIAIADQVHADRFHLFGASQGGQVAAAVAARLHDRTDRLVLYGTCADGAAQATQEVRASLVSLVRAHWGLGSRTLAGIFMPDPTPEDVREFDVVQRSASTSEVAADLLNEYYDTDITALLPTIEAPTLVLHREEDKATKFALGRTVASLIPNATLVPLEGSTHLFWKGDWQAVLGAMLDFLPRPQPAETARLSPRELEVAALVADGMTNQDIARTLFIAPRTAETHVENLLKKLGFRSRAQVAAWIVLQKTQRGRDPAT